MVFYKCLAWDMLVLSSDAHAAPSLPSLSVPDGDTSDHSHDCFSLRSLVKEPEPGNGQPSRSSQYCDLALISLRRPDLQLYHQFRAECFYDLCCTAWYRTGIWKLSLKLFALKTWKVPTCYASLCTGWGIWSWTGVGLTLFLVVPLSSRFCGCRSES